MFIIALASVLASANLPSFGKAGGRKQDTQSHRIFDSI